jgi:hypothetical protein
MTDPMIAPGCEINTTDVLGIYLFLGECQQSNHAFGCVPHRTFVVRQVAIAADR